LLTFSELYDNQINGNASLYQQNLIVKIKGTRT